MARPHGKAECRELGVGRTLLACRGFLTLGICGTAGPSSGNLFLDLEGEGLLAKCLSEGWLLCPPLTKG